MFGLLSKANPVNETDVIKNAIFDAFLDNCLGVPSVKVDGDDDSISFTVRHFGTYGQIRVEVKRSINKWAISVKAQDPSRVNRKCYSDFTQTSYIEKVRGIVSSYLHDGLSIQARVLKRGLGDETFNLIYK